MTCALRLLFVCPLPGCYRKRAWVVQIQMSHHEFLVVRTALQQEERALRVHGIRDNGVRACRYPQIRESHVQNQHFTLPRTKRSVGKNGFVGAASGFLHCRALVRFIQGSMRASASIGEGKDRSPFALPGTLAELRADPPPKQPTKMERFSRGTVKFTKTSIQ